MQEIPLEQLSDIKAKSIAEWIANERVRRSIIRHFRHFLMTYVDENGASVYGQRIRNLGESMLLGSFVSPNTSLMLVLRQLRIFGGLLSSPRRVQGNPGVLPNQFPLSNARYLR